MDIYIKEVDGPGINRLTTDPQMDCCPAWSPDGGRIAFLRRSGDRWILYLISPLGGGERKLAEVYSGRLRWSPDGKSIAFVDRKSPKDPISIWSLSVETPERKQLTAPAAGSFGDSDAAFSPDGRHLTFVRQIDLSRSALRSALRSASLYHRLAREGWLRHGTQNWEGVRISRLERPVDMQASLRAVRL